METTGLDWGLEGKSVIVAGASSGIGAATASAPTCEPRCSNRISTRTTLRELDRREHAFAKDRRSRRIGTDHCVPPLAGPQGQRLTSARSLNGQGVGAGNSARMRRINRVGSHGRRDSMSE